MEFTTENGARVVINPASFKEATLLKNIILNEFKKANISETKVEELLNKDVASVLEPLKNVIIGIDTSSEFEMAIFKCLHSCTYDEKRINIQLFDDIPTAREDYYEIILKCIEVNLRPLFKSLLSKFATLQGKIGENLKPPSAQNPTD